MKNIEAETPPVSPCGHRSGVPRTPNLIMMSPFSQIELSPLVGLGATQLSQANTPFSATLSSLMYDKRDLIFFLILSTGALLPILDVQAY
jgi:hypothetical protein